MVADLARMIGDEALARVFVGRLYGAEIGIERRLGIDDDRLAAWERG